MFKTKSNDASFNKEASVTSVQSFDGSNAIDKLLINARLAV